MIRAAFFAGICLMLVAITCALGVLSRWDAVWLLLIVPSTTLLAFGAADAAVDRYNWWALIRAERAARDYGRSEIWNHAVQMRLNQRVARLAARIK